MREERTSQNQDSARQKLGSRPSRSFWVGLTVTAFISALYLLSIPGTLKYLRTSLSPSRPGCISEDPAALALQLQIPRSSRQRSILGHQGPYTPPFLNFTVPPVRHAEPGQEEGEVLAAVIIVSPRRFNQSKLHGGRLTRESRSISRSCNDMPLDILPPQS